MKIINQNKLSKDFFKVVSFSDIKIVKKILKDIEKSGDKAVLKYSRKFDKIKGSNIEVSKQDIKKAYSEVSEETISTLRKAAENIRFFAEKQFSQLKNFEVNKDGNLLGQKIVPIEIVGCYVPGGRYPLPSTALMNVIPSSVAGVKEIIVCSPKIKPGTIVAADIAGATKIFNIGGIQAIAAMAYGTKTIPKVDKIVGPGNKYVTAAKKEVYGRVGIDFIAGPSEVMVISDETGNPSFIAADLIAQCEHDPEASAVLITTSRNLAETVVEEIEEQLEKLSTKDTAKAGLKKGLIILVQNISQAIDIANKKAPEHLEIQVKSPKKIVGKLNNYGSLFIGKYSAEVFGDYCSGTNHTLPTNGAARYTGGLSVNNFVKILTYQEISEKGAKKIGKIASILAEIEGLDAHKNAADIRFEER